MIVSRIFKQVVVSSSFSRSSSLLSASSSFSPRFLQRRSVGPLLSSSFSSSPSPTVSEKKHRIIILGPPGSGKGTQTSNMKRDFGLKAIILGDILRSFVSENNNELSKHIKQMMEGGNMVDDSIVLKLLSSAFQSQDASHGWILDGYPRNEIQASHLNEILEKTDQKLSHVLYLNVDEVEVAERIKGRLIHPPSGRVYHITYNPPKMTGLDDITGEPLEARKDDHPELVLSRLREYKEKTLPLIHYYEQLGLLSTISAHTSADGYVIIRRILSRD